MEIIKVKDLPYVRYTIEEGKAAFEKFEAAMKDAMCVNCVLRARKAFREEMKKYETQYSLAYCRYTLNTKDEFYKGEMDYYDNVGPLFSEIGTNYAALMLDSPYRADLEKKLGSRLFKMWEIARKTFSPEIITDLQEENTVVTEYSQLMSTMVFVYNGEEMPLSFLRGKLEDADRSVRKAAAIAIG
jgi:oligoendopeptidase F